MTDRLLSALLVLATTVLVLSSCADSLAAPRDAPPGDHYVAVEAGKMSLAEAAKTASDLGASGAGTAAQHLVTATSSFGKTEVVTWAGMMETADGTFAQLCVGLLTDNPSGQPSRCDNLGRTFGLPDVTVGETVAGGTALRYVLIDGSSAIVEWMIVTTSSGDTIVAKVANGTSYIEWAQAELGELRSVQVLKSNHEEFWSQTYSDG